MTKNVEATVEVTEVKKIEFNQTYWDSLVTEHKSISGAIRHLAATGMSRGDIARTSGKRYQHVRNVLTQPLKKA